MAGRAGKVAMVTGLFILAYAAVTVVRCGYLNNALQGDGPTHEQFTAAVSRMRPLVEALNAYHRRHGLFPANLAALGAEGFDAANLAAGYIYSAQPPDQIYRSPACEKRWRSEFEGLILKTDADLDRLKAVFASECLVGYRQIALQSPNFIFYGARTFPGVDRWASYSSFTDRWSIGWCSHEESERGQSLNAAANGVCRP